MASSSKDKNAAEEQAIPPSVIAQAEAAIYGNLEVPGSSKDLRQRPSVAEQSAKHHGTREKRSATTTGGRHASRPTFARSATRLVRLSEGGTNIKRNANV